MANAVECQRECLQVCLMLQRHDWNLGQTVIVQPQVSELLQALETVLRHHCDVVRIQAPRDRREREKEVQVKSTVTAILSKYMNTRGGNIMRAWKLWDVTTSFKMTF